MVTKVIKSLESRDVIIKRSKYEVVYRVKQGCFFIPSDDYRCWVSKDWRFGIVEDYKYINGGEELVLQTKINFIPEKGENVYISELDKVVEVVNCARGWDCDILYIKDELSYIENEGQLEECKKQIEEYNRSIEK